VVETTTVAEPTVTETAAPTEVPTTVAPVVTETPVVAALNLVPPTITSDKVDYVMGDVVREETKERIFDPEHLSVAHGPSHDAPKHISSPLIGREHAIADQEGGGPAVISNHPHGNIGPWVLPIGDMGNVCNLSEDRVVPGHLDYVRSTEAATSVARGRTIIRNRCNNRIFISPSTKVSYLVQPMGMSSPSVGLSNGLRAVGSL
jgi:hypothetical protein